MSDVQLSKYAGRGQSTVQTSQSVPFLRVLQSTSVEIDPSKKGHDLKKIDGAKVGDLFCSGIGVLKQPVQIVPVKFMHYYEEQIGSGNNVRVVGKHGIEIQRSPAYTREEVVEKGKKRFLEMLTVDTIDGNGRPVKVKNRLVMTVLMGVLLPEYKNTPAIIKFQSTGLAKARELQTAISRYRYPNDPYTLPPTFERSFTLKTAPESNDEGGWMGMQFSVGRVLSDTVDTELKDLANGLVDQDLLLRGEVEKTDEEDAPATTAQVHTDVRGAGEKPF